MRKMTVAVFFILISSLSWADNAPTEQDYKNLEQLRAKLVRMRREMDAFVKDLTGPYAGMDRAGAMPFGQDVRVDVTQNEKNIVVRADLPGMSKDKIDIVLEKDRVLKISGSREAVIKEEGPGVVRQERMSGRFERTLELPAECESHGITATYKEGVLEVILLKKKIAKEEVVKVSVQ